MNSLKKQMLFIAALMLALFLQSASAQNIDANRMNRDINILENVLQEMFKTQVAHGDRIRIHSARAFAFGRSHDIRGTYLPKYGVIFTIPSNQPDFVVFNGPEGNNYSFNFQYGDGDEGEKITKESITNRVVEFLQDYGSTLGQLSENDRIMVIYNSDTPDHNVAVFSSTDDETVERKSIPTISVVAKMSDLKAYRSGDINEKELRNRLDISTADNSKKQMDLKVMANIFKTAFEETEGKSFRVVGSVDYLKLDNFGALFSFDARYSSVGWGGLHESLDVMRGKLAEARIELRREVEAEKEKEVAEERKNREEKQAQQKEEVLNAYNQFLSDLKEYLVDYGRTLNSVESNQHILVSVILDSRNNEIPERIDLQISKSNLEAMDKGDMNREQAINEINVREY